METMTPPDNPPVPERGLRADTGLVELHGPETPVQPSDHLLIIRSLVMATFALLVFLLDTWEVARIGVPVLLLAAAVQPPTAALVPSRRHLLLLHILIDVVLVLILSSLNSDYVLPGVMCLVALGVHYVTSVSIRGSAPAVAATLSGIVGASYLGGVPHVERVAVVAVALLLLYGQLGYQTRDLVRRSRRDLHTAVQAAGGLTYLTDAETVTFEIGGDVQPLLGFTTAEWEQVPPHEIVHPDDLVFMMVDHSALREGQILDRTARFRHKNGDWVWIRDVGRVVMHEKRPFIHGFLFDVTAERAGLQKMTDEATTDQLTGLANRRSMFDALGELDGQQNYALILMDLNRFKEINDTLGHEAGDQLLTVVAERLRASVRPNDHLCRLGGDEFAVVMRDVTEPSTVSDAVERFALEVARPIQLNGLQLTASFSAGIVQPGQDDSTAVTMLRHADVAMYAAKRSSQLSVVFDVGLEQQLERRIQLLEALPAALEDGSLTLRYQPIIECSTGRIAGVEGLARWEHPAFGLLAPDAFLDVVLLSERTGYYNRAMDSAAMRAGLQLGPHADGPFSVAVNVPVPVMEDIAFEAWFIEERVRLGAIDVNLVFEIAEGDVHHSEAMAEAITRFTALGVSISVDDFGTGNATFERLRWRNVGQLKIDRGMVDAASASARDRSVLESVAELATGLDYTVVAEGVETEEQFDMIKAMGITRVQGWLFSPAVPLGEIATLLEGGGFVDHSAVVGEYSTA